MKNLSDAERSPRQSWPLALVVAVPASLLSTLGRARVHLRRAHASAPLFIAAVTLCLMVVGPTAVFASGTTTEPQPSSDAPAFSYAPEAESTNAAAAAELPHSDLTRPEVEALLEGVFGTQLEAVAGPFDDLTVDEFLSPHAAVVTMDPQPEANAVLDGETSQQNDHLLLESSVPLRNEGAAVDLSLEGNTDGFESDNPLVSVAIPDQLGQGIGLPESGINVTLPEAPSERAPSLVDEASALYPNIAPDMDFVVSPAPTGFETFTLFRSPDAPREQRLQLDLPPGSELVKEDDGSVAVKNHDEDLMRVSPPSAIDAEGQPVPATMTVDGQSLILGVAPDQTTAWPVLLDPMFETYQWEGTSLTACGDFKLEGGPLVEANSLFSWNCGTIATGSYTVRGLAVKANPGTFSFGAYEQFSHEVPRLKQDQLSGTRPTSYFAGMTLSNVTVVTSGGSASPYAIGGIWNDMLANWAGKAPYQAVWAYPGNAASVFNGTIGITSGGDKEAKIAIPTALWVNESMATASGARRFSIGAVSFEVADDDLPGVINPSGASAWIDGTAKEAISATVHDTGLGAKKATFAIPGQGNVAVENSCTGNVANPCPVSWKATLSKDQYNPALMPQGETFVRVTGSDVVANASIPANALVLIDHSKPELSVSGSLTEQATVGTKLLEYNLGYTAADGDDAAATAQTSFGVQGTGAGQLERPQGVAVDGSGNIWVADSINHRLLKFGPTGNLLKQVGSFGSGNGQFNDPRGIAISSSGSIWVADSGNQRLQQLNGNGEFIRSVTHPEFSVLWGVATAPGGAVWVVDRLARKAFKFRESDGAYLDVAGDKSPGQLSVPLGIAADPNGNVWVVDHSAGKIKKYDKDGNYQTEFGSIGIGNGQLTNPVGIAVTASGNLLVTDRDNHRVQEFEVDGGYLRKWGAKGSASNQLLEPLGIAAAPGGLAYVADAGNHRISRWTHADRNPQSGTANLQIKVDGNPVKTEAPGCSTKNCSINGSWTLRADDYSAGQHTVEVVATDAVGIAATKTLTIETHGDRTDPTIALAGSMTQQPSLGTTLPSYKLRVDATDPGPVAERKSGIASTTIKVDGVVVNLAAPGCPAEECSIVREWTLNSENYAVGQHLVEVKATDAAGRSTTKSLLIDIARDTTAPEIAALGKIYSAPSGWLEQKLYGYTAEVTDKGGYGVTSVQLKIDGALVKDSSNSCPQGECSQLFGYGQKIDINAYDGGAHPAELIATDGAGNKRKRIWTINVAPDGQIPPLEATETLEAMEETVPSDRYFLPVAPTTEYLEPAIIEAGDNPHFKEEGGNIESTGVTVDTTFDTDTEALTIEGTEGPLELTPATPTQDPEIVSGAAMVLPSNQVGADTVIRPEYNGAHMFTTIRDPSAPESYEWHAKLQFGQYLEQPNPQQIEVKWANETTAFLITAEPAHDATGKEVPTSLSILNGSDFALSVPHQGKEFTYPVAAGSSYETGYATVTVYFPQEVEEQEAIEKEEAEDPITFEELDELNGEILQMQAYRTAGGGHRDPDKPVKKRQARKIIRVKRNALTVPAPSGASASANEPDGPPRVRFFEVDGEVWSNFNRDIWQVEIDEGVFARGPDWAAFTQSSEPENWHCKHHVDDWWTWNIDLDVTGHWTLGPNRVYKGENKHLTLWCEYNVEIYPLPELVTMDQDQRFELWIYPNGYQATHGAAPKGIQISEN